MDTVWMIAAVAVVAIAVGRHGGTVTELVVGAVTAIAAFVLYFHFGIRAHNDLIASLCSVGFGMAAAWRYGLWRDDLPRPRRKR